jgi:hypothetical protein
MRGRKALRAVFLFLVGKVVACCERVELSLLGRDGKGRGFFLRIFGYQSVASRQMDMDMEN